MSLSLNPDIAEQFEARQMPSLFTASAVTIKLSEKDRVASEEARVNLLGYLVSDSFLDNLLRIILLAIAMPTTVAIKIPNITVKINSGTSIPVMLKTMVAGSDLVLTQLPLES
jgi:hypothetical protein